MYVLVKRIKRLNEKMKMIFVLFFSLLSQLHDPTSVSLIMDRKSQVFCRRLCYWCLVYSRGDENFFPLQRNIALLALVKVVQRHYTE